MRVALSVGGKFQAFHLAQELQRHGYLFRLITTYFGYNARGMQIDRRRVVTNIGPELWFRIPTKIPLLNRWISGEARKFTSFDQWASRWIDGADLVVAWAGFGLATLRRARTLGMKTVVERASTHRTFQRELLEEEYARQRMKRSFDRYLEERDLAEYEVADYISVPSHFALQSFIAKGVAPEKLSCIPFGVSLQEFRRIPKEDRTFRVLFVGAASFRKGLHYLLEAVSDLRLPNFETWIIASVSDEIKPLMSKYRHSFRHLGTVPFLELYRYYSQASVFVLPSIEEGLALTLLQAMACGLPVICTPNTGGEDVVRDGLEGFVVPPRDPKAIRERIRHLYENERVRDRMAEAAFTRVRDEFSWGQYAAQMIRFYKRVLGQAVTR